MVILIGISSNIKRRESERGNASEGFVYEP